ncbi:MAG: hypothetical protein CMO80_05595 [Verrucomicrobiales bacterium]|nr:hypothetical protein [Verrucomicrobiales bacterium]
MTVENRVATEAAKRNCFSLEGSAPSLLKNLGNDGAFPSSYVGDEFMNSQLATMYLIIGTAALHAAEPIDIGGRRELFVDRPWEGNTSGHVTVLRDGDLYKMIYRASDMVWHEGKLQFERSPVVCYAESRDCICLFRQTEFVGPSGTIR